MNRISKSSSLSTSTKRPDIYKLAAAAIRTAAAKHGLTTAGNLKTNPQDSARRTALTDKDSKHAGYGYCSPKGAWWLSNGKHAHLGIFDEGTVEEVQVTA